MIKLTKGIENTEKIMKWFFIFFVIITSPARSKAVCDFLDELSFRNCATEIAENSCKEVTKVKEYPKCYNNKIDEILKDLGYEIIGFSVHLDEDTSGCKIINKKLKCPMNLYMQNITCTRVSMSIIEVCEFDERCKKILCPLKGAPKCNKIC